MLTEEVKAAGWRFLFNGMDFAMARTASPVEVNAERRR